LLEHTLADEVNVINSQVFCRERGIKLSISSSSETGSFRSSMEATVSGDGQTQSAGGTLFGEQMPRLFEINAFRLEAFLDGHMLMFGHQDVPGIIGGIGTLLAEYNINIAQMAVGRSGDAPGGPAVGILNVDQIVPEEAIAAMGNIEGVSAIKQVTLPKRGSVPAWLQ
jgi:D-3-phosphoglycerate dehydrogenase